MKTVLRFGLNIDQPLVDRLRRFPREPDMLVYGVRALVALIIRGWLRIYHRFEIIGHENLRQTTRSLSLQIIPVISTRSVSWPHCPCGNCIARSGAAADYFSKARRGLWLRRVTNALPFARRVRVARVSRSARTFSMIPKIF